MSTTRSGAWILLLSLTAVAPVSPWAIVEQPPKVVANLGLSLPDLAERLFVNGGLIEVPDGARMRRLEVRLGAPHARNVQEGDILVRLDDRPLRITVVTMDNTKIARFQVVDATKPLVVRKGTDLHIRGYVKDRELSQEWIVRAGPTPFIVEKAGDKDGERLNIALKVPADRPILFQGTAMSSIDVRGEVFPARHLRRLTVADTVIQPDRTQDRLVFGASANVSAATSEVVVEAADDLGRVAAVVIPLVKAGQPGNTPP